jgi:O-antigen ligase
MAAASVESIRKREFSAEQLVFWCFLGVFLTMPIGTSPSLICGGLAGSIWLFSGMAFRAGSLVKQRWTWPVLVMIVLPWASLLYAPDPWGSGFQYAGKTYYWVFSFALASALPFRTHWLIRAFLVGLAINAFVGGLQFAGVLAPKQGWYSGLTRGYNTVTIYLVLGILLSAFYFREARERIKQVALLLLMGLYFFHLIVLEGRTGYLTFVVLFPLIAKTLYARLSIVKTVSVGVILIGVMFLSPLVRERVDLTVRQLKYHMETDPSKAWGREYTVHQDRFYYWHGAVELFLENPVLGVGAGAYPKALKEKRDPGDPLIAHPHNNLLYMAASWGLVGLAAFLWLFVEVFRNGLRQRDTALGHLIVCTVLVVFVNGLFNTTIMDSGPLFLLSLVVGLQQGLPEFAGGTGVGNSPRLAEPRYQTI